MGSGKGRYSGRGIKGQKSRAGSHTMRAGFEGGQMPLCMRLPKLRGNTSKDAMPVGPFRTYTQPVNIRDLERFEAGDEVTPETLKAKGLIRSLRKDVKLLGDGELTKKLTITVHARLGDRAREGRGGRRHADAAQGAEGAKAKKHKAPPRRREAESRGDRRPRSRRPRPSRASRPTSRERGVGCCSPGSPTRGASRSSGAGSSSPR